MAYAGRAGITSRKGAILTSAAIMFAAAMLISTVAAAQNQFMGLTFGSTRQEVEPQTGPFRTSRSSFRNAFDVRSLPNETFGNRLLDAAIDDRTLYFDDSGRLYRVRLELKPEPKYDAERALEAYEALKRILADRNFTLQAAHEPNAFVGAGLEPCNQAFIGRLMNDEPTTRRMLPLAAPRMSSANRLAFDLACGAHKDYGSIYRSSPQHAYRVNLAASILYNATVVFNAYLTAPGEHPDEVERRHRRGPAF